MPKLYAASREAQLKEFIRVYNALRAEFPDFELVRKADSRLMHVIDFLLRLATLGRMKKFMTDYTTTIGHVVYIPSSWDSKLTLMKASVLRHERVHMRQRKRLGAWKYELTYLFWPLPMVFAAGRRGLEMEAYEETLRAYTDYFGPPLGWTDDVREGTIRQFMGPNYLWMWPFRKDVERWYDAAVDKLNRENIHGQA